MLRLENWSLYQNADRMRDDFPDSLLHYRHDRCLTGQVYNHPKHPDGEWGSTSRVVVITRDGNARTVSGSTYALGTMEEAFRRFRNIATDAIDHLRAARGSGADE